MPNVNPYAISAQADIISGQTAANYFCPYCASRSRERLLYFFFQPMAPLTKKKILHIAPEKKLYDYIAACEPEEYVCGDIAPREYRFANAKKIDLLQITYGDHYFDMVICNHVLEHIENDAQAMKEIHRVLKPSGFAVLLVPIGASLSITHEDWSRCSPEEKAETFGQHDHVRIYAENDYINRLTAAGFTVVPSKPPLSAEKMVRYCINPREILYVAHKTPLMPAGWDRRG